MKARIRIGTLIVLLATVFALSGCPQHPYGIFASIERERPILHDRNLGKELTVGSMAKAGGMYFAATGALYFRRVDDPAAGLRPEWDIAPAPAVGDRTLLTTSIASASLGAAERIFAVFYSQDASVSGVYEIDPDTPHGTPSLVFDPATDFPDEIRRVDRVFSVDDGTQEWLIVSASTTATPAWHHLYVSNNGTDFELVEGAGFQHPVVAVASGGAGRVAYLTASEVAAHTAGVDPAAPPAFTTPEGTAKKAAAANFTGMMYQSDTLWLADNRGHLYSSKDFGRPWTKGPVNPVSTADDRPVPFTTFAAVPRGAETIVVVGTRGYGYRVVGDAAVLTATTPVSSPDVPGSNYQGSDLATAVVETFFVDPDPVTGFPVQTAEQEEEWDGHLFFVGTAGKGLWRTLSSVSGPNQWVRE